MLEGLLVAMERRPLQLQSAAQGSPKPWAGGALQCLGGRPERLGSAQLDPAPRCRAPTSHVTATVGNNWHCKILSQEATIEKWVARDRITPWEYGAEELESSPDPVSPLESPTSKLSPSCDAASLKILREVASQPGGRARVRAPGRGEGACLGCLGRLAIFADFVSGCFLSE